MAFKKKNLLLALVLIGLSACAGTEPHGGAVQPDQYVQPDIAPDAAATIVTRAPQTGFLGIGRTGLGIVLVDGKQLTGVSTKSTRYVPGMHAILFRAFSDPIGAYACVTINLEKGKSYVARTTEPSWSSTTIWIEDAETGQVVGPKYQAKMFHEPLDAGFLVQAILAHPIPPCPAPADAKGAS